MRRAVLKLSLESVETNLNAAKKPRYLRHLIEALIAAARCNQMGSIVLPAGILNPIVVVTHVSIEMQYHRVDADGAHG